MRQDQATSERWLPAYRWAGYYEVSNCGQVRSVDRTVQRKDGRRPYLRRGQPIAPVIDGNGYYAVRLFRNGQRVEQRVHILVLETFDRPRPPGMAGRHGPGGQLDNRWPENLCWGTPAENAADRVRDGTNCYGERIASAKMTDAIILECRQRSATGESQRALAREFKVSPTMIGMALRGVTWKHVGGELQDGLRDRGERHRRARLTNAIVIDARQRAAAGETIAGLARELGVSETAIRQAVQRKTWRHVPSPPVSESLSACRP